MFYHRLSIFLIQRQNTYRFMCMLEFMGTWGFFIKTDRKCRRRTQLESWTFYFSYIFLLPPTTSSGYTRFSLQIFIYILFSAFDYDNNLHFIHTYFSQAHSCYNVYTKYISLLYFYSSSLIYYFILYFIKWAKPSKPVERCWSCLRSFLIELKGSPYWEETKNACYVPPYKMEYKIAPPRRQYIFRKSKKKK